MGNSILQIVKSRVQLNGWNQHGTLGGQRGNPEHWSCLEKREPAVPQALGCMASGVLNDGLRGSDLERGGLVAESLPCLSLWSPSLPVNISAGLSRSYFECVRQTQVIHRLAMWRRTLIPSLNGYWSRPVSGDG